MFGGHFQVENKVAVITGASQGFGAELAYQLYSRGCSVILVARREQSLIKQVERIKKELTEKPGLLVDYIVADTSVYDDAASLWKELTIRGLDPDIWASCAGSSIPKLFGDLTKQDLEVGIDANFKTALNFANTGFKQVLQNNAGQPLKEYKRRHLLLMSSVTAFFQFIGYNQYSPMKCAVHGLSLGLRQEFAPYNIRVSCIYPGNFDSEGFREEQKTKPEITKKIEGPSEAIPVEKCVSIVINQLDRNYDTVTTDFIGWVLSALVLGTQPRAFGILQVLVSFVFALIAPLLLIFIQRDINNYFKQKEKHK